MGDAVKLIDIKDSFSDKIKSHKVIHYDVDDENFTLLRMVFASNYAKLCYYDYLRSIDSKWTGGQLERLVFALLPQWPYLLIKELGNSEAEYTKNFFERRRSEISFDCRRNECLFGFK